VGKHTDESMVTHSFRLPEKLRARMRGHDWVNWSVVVRSMLENKVNQLDRIALSSTKESECE